MDEIIQVSAGFDEAGQPLPQRFVWRGTVYTIEEVGRRYEEAGWLHMMVMTPDKLTWELAYAPSSSEWRLVGGSGPSGPARL